MGHSFSVRLHVALFIGISGFFCFLRNKIILCDLWNATGWFSFQRGRFLCWRSSTRFLHSSCHYQISWLCEQHVNKLIGFTTFLNCPLFKLINIPRAFSNKIDLVYKYGTNHCEMLCNRFCFLFLQQSEKSVNFLFIFKLNLLTNFVTKAHLFWSNF